MDDFERIYAEYYDQVYGYCLRLTHDPHMAEEVTQESFFKALKAIGSFHGCAKSPRTPTSPFSKSRNGPPRWRATGPPPRIWRSAWGTRRTP